MAPWLCEFQGRTEAETSLPQCSHLTLLGKTKKLKCNLLILYWSQYLYSSQREQLVILLFGDFEDLRNIFFSIFLLRVCTFVFVYFSTTNIIHMYALVIKELETKL